MVGTYQPDMYRLTLTSWLFFHRGFVIRSNSPLLYNLGLPYVIHILIMVSTRFRLSIFLFAKYNK
jgi:hypothetical protein